MEHFLNKLQTQYRKKIPGISDKAMQALMKYDWPGNIRELESMVERGIILTDNNQLIDLDALCPSLGLSAQRDSEITRDGHLQPSVRHNLYQLEPVCDSMLDEGFEFGEFERRLISTAMHKAERNVSQAARLLGLTRAQLAYRLEKLESVKEE